MEDGAALDIWHHALPQNGTCTRQVPGQVVKARSRQLTSVVDSCAGECPNTLQFPETMHQCCLMLPCSKQRRLLNWWMQMQFCWSTKCTYLREQTFSS